MAAGEFFLRVTFLRPALTGAEAPNNRTSAAAGGNNKTADLSYIRKKFLCPGLGRNMTEISSYPAFATLLARPIFRLRTSHDAPLATMELRQRIRLMSPEERQMLTDLFERVRGQANAPRDRDAETLIADAIRTQPYAPYLLTQAVLLQEQALRAADQKLQELQAQVAHMQDELAHAQAQPSPSSGSFLGGLFGGGASRPAPQQPAANPNPWVGGQQQPGYAPPQPQQSGPAAGPWGAPQPQQGGGFLKGALGAAAGVAGGMLLAESFKGLLGGGQANAAGLGGLGSGIGGLGSGSGGERVVNNYYEAPQSKDDTSDANDDDSGDYDDNSADDFGGGDDYGDDI
jgi:uncharacterized protein